MENAVCKEELACQLNPPFCNIYMLIPTLQNLSNPSKNHQMNFKWGMADEIICPNWWHLKHGHAWCWRNCCFWWLSTTSNRHRVLCNVIYQSPFINMQDSSPLRSMKWSEILLVTSKWTELVYTTLRGPLRLLRDKSYVRNDDPCNWEATITIKGNEIVIPWVLTKWECWN